VASATKGDDDMNIWLSKYALGDQRSTGELFPATFVQQASGSVQVQDANGQTLVLQPLGEPEFYQWAPLSSFPSPPPPW
jgi:hypothetical protein